MTEPYDPNDPEEIAAAQAAAQKAKDLLAWELEMDE